MIWGHICSYLWLHEAGGGWGWAKGGACLAHPDTVVLGEGTVERFLDKRFLVTWFDWLENKADMAKL